MNTPNLPAHLQNRTTRGLAQALVANLGAGSPPYVSIKGNRFTLIDATGAEEAVPTFAPQLDQFGVLGPYLDAVIIDLNEHTSKVFYDKAYDPSKEGEQPACWSDNGMAPSRGAQSPQSALCNSCQWNIWGSATSKVSGKGIKACHDVQKIAVMLPDDDVVFLMRVPPNSRTNLRDYTLKFLGQQIDIPDVITRISFDQQTLGTLQFVAVGFIPEGEMHRRDKFLVEKKTDALVGRTDQPITGAIAAPAAQPALAAPQVQQPTPQVFQPQPMQQVQQPVPFTQPAANAGVQQSPSAVQSAPATASPSEQPKRRQRRTKAQIAADAAAQGQGQAPAAPQQPAGAPVAPFRTEAPATASAQPAGAPVAPFRTEAPATASAQPGQATGAAFGIQQGVAPNPELTSVLNGIFGR